MINAGQSIKINMLQGDPDGVLKCTEYNWSGVVYKAKDNFINITSDDVNFDMRAMYILFFVDKKSGEKYFHIGHAKYYEDKNNLLISNGGFLDRDKIKIESAILIQKINDNITESEFNFIKSELEYKISFSNEYKKFVQSSGFADSLKKSQKTDLNKFISNSIKIMKCLGYNIFDQKFPIVYDEDMYFLSTRNNKQGMQIEAYAKVVDGKFRVLAGSMTVQRSYKSISAQAVKERRKGHIEKKSEQRKFIKDYDYDSINLATQVILGRASYWREDWIDNNGNKIGDKYPDDLNSAKTIKKPYEKPIQIQKPIHQEDEKAKENTGQAKKKIKNKENARYSISDDMDLAYTKPRKLVVDNMSYDVNSWNELLVKAVRVLYEIKKEDFRILTLMDEFENKFSRRKSNLRRPRSVGPGIYIETNLSAKDIRKFVMEMYKAFELEEYVYFYLQE